MRSKKTIAVVAITLILAIVAIVGTVAYLNDDGTAKAGFEENNTLDVSQNGNDDNAQTNEDNSINNDENNSGEQTGNGEQNSTSETTTVNRQEGNSTTTTTNNNANVPNQEYVTERIEEVERQITEDLLVGWTPISLNTTYSTASLGIYKPELNKTKVVATEKGKSYVIPGEILTYGIAVKNIGNEEMTGVNISDIVPDKTSLVNGSIYLYQNEEYNFEVGNYNEGLNKINWKVDISAGEMIIVGFAVTVNDDAKGTIRNVAIVNGEETNETENPIVIFDKSVKQTEPLHEGDIIDYTITIENTGEIDAIVEEVTDKIPDGTTYVEKSANNDAVFAENTLIWNDISLAKGEKINLTFQVKVNELPEGVFSLNIINVAVVDGEDTNKVENNVVKPNITRLKANSPTGNVHEGETITYTITAGNTGTEAKEIEVTDEAPEGTILNANSIVTPEGAVYSQVGNNGVKWTITLQPGDSKEFKFTVIVDELLGGTYTLNIPNTAVVDGEDTNKVENNVVKPNITRLKANSPTGNVHEGETITYTITAGNTGTEAKEIEVTDEAPEGTTLNANSIVTPEGAVYEQVGNNGVKWTITLQPGDSKEFKFTVIVDELLGGTYTLNIPNTAVVDGEDTNKVENNVVKPHIVNKTKSSEPASGTEVQYNGEITYTIRVENDGSDSKAVTITDEIPQYTTFVESKDGSLEKINGKEIVVWNKIVPEKIGTQNGYVEVSFKVKVTAGYAGDKIKNIGYVSYDGKKEETNETIHPIKDQLTVTSTSKNGKNIVIVLDLSSSMLQVKKGDLDENQYDTTEYGTKNDTTKYGRDEYIYPYNASNCVELSESKLAYAKQAIKQFATAVMAENPENRLTLITFNYDSVAELQSGNETNFSYYWEDYQNYKKIIGNYVGTKTLISKEDSATDFNNAVDNIKIRSRYLLTNMRRAIEYTSGVVDSMASDGKEINVIFFGDGKPSYTSEACTVEWSAQNGYGFFDIDTTNSKIGTAGSAIRNTSGTKMFTVEYLVPSGEETYANEAFEAITGVSTRDEQTRFSATEENVVEKLTNIASNLDIPVTNTHNISNDGTVEIKIPAGNTLRISNVEPLELKVNKTTYTYTTIAEINSSDKITYVEGDATKQSKFIINTRIFEPGSEISLNYYYKMR